MIPILKQTPNLTDTLSEVSHKDNSATVISVTHQEAQSALGTLINQSPTVVECPQAVTPPLEKFSGLTLNSINYPTSVFDAEGKLKEDQKVQIRDAVKSEWNNIQQKNESATLHFLCGHHMTVFEHKDFPGLVLKLCGLWEAEDNIKNVKISQVIVKENQFDKCYIPEADWFALDEVKGLIVMEKVKGIIGIKSCIEESENIFENFTNDPDLQEVWRSAFIQAAKFICLAGYGDSGWNNMLLMPNGFGFVDFERFNKSYESLLEGLHRLVRMAPPEFFEDLAVIAEENGIPPKFFFDAFKAYDEDFFKVLTITEAKKRKTEELQSHAQLRQKNV